MVFAFDDTTNPATNSYADFAAAYGPSSMPSAGAGAPSAGPSSSTKPVPMVYVGTKTVSVPPTGSYDFTPQEWQTYGHQTTDIAHVQTIPEALKHFDKMTAKEQHNMLRLLIIGGFAGNIDLKNVDDIVKSASLQDARDAYTQLLMTANDYYQNSGLMVTPKDVLKSALAYRLGAEGIKWDGNLNAFDNGVSNSAPVKDLSKTTTQTYKTVDFMDPMDAKNLTRGMLQQELGRDPTQAEYEDFLSAINAAERHDPSVTHVTSQYGSDGSLLHQNTVTHQGIGAAGLQQVAYEKAQNQPGWAEWQAMGTYAPALFSALGAAVPGV